MSTLNNQYFFKKIQSSKSKYSIEIVNNWYKSFYAWNLVQHQNYTPLIRSNLNVNSSILHEQQHQENTQAHNTNLVEPTYKIPTLTRRFLAEGFDAIYVQLFKIMILFLIISNTDLINEDMLNFNDFFDNLLTEDSFKIPLELLGLEFLYIFVSFVFESFCLYKYGHTPGKYIFKLKIVSCSQVHEISPSLVQILPGTKLSLKMILLRTILKNFSMMFLFPTIIFFLMPAFMEYGQTSYDKASESIVVQIP